MNTSSVFSLQRFYLVLRRHMMYNQKTLLVSFAAAGAFLLVVSFLNTFASRGVFSIEIFSILGMVLFFVGGYLVSSRVFNELHTPARGQFFLTLPASNLEKLATAWLVSAPLYAITALLGLTLLSLLATLLNALAFGSEFVVFNPLTKSVIYMAGIYLVTQSIFLLGAVYFRKNNFMKTLLALFVIQAVISTVLSLVFYLMFGRGGFQVTGEEMMVFPVFITDWLPRIMKIVFWGLMAPFFLVVSYVRLKEREV
jgi:hypothetical protein